MFGRNKKPEPISGAGPAEDDPGRLKERLAEETARRMALERELARIEVRMGRFLVEEAVETDGVAAIGADGRILHCNPAMARLAGAAGVAELIGRAPSEAWGEPDPESEGADRPARAEILLFRPDGGTVEVSVRTTRLTGEGAVSWISVYRDIGEHMAAERELKKANLQFRQLAENMSEVLWIGSEDRRRWTYISPAFEKIWGRRIEDLKDPLGFSTIHPEDRKAYLLAFSQLEERDHTVMDYRIERPDGDIRWIRTRAFPIRDEHGVTLRIGGTSEDITDRKAAEEAMREAERQREQFYRFLVHDLNKPLAAIAGFSSSLKNREELAEPLRPVAERINNAAQRLRGIVSQVLEIQRIQRGDVTIQLRAADLRRLIAETTSYLEDKDLDREILVEGRLLGTPSAAEPLPVHTDPICLGRILQNLIDNALKYGRSRVEIGVEEKEAVVHVRVWNDGPPVPAELLERIFSEFYRAGGQKAEGSGIGLASVRRLAGMIRSRVWAEAPSGGGTLFIVEIPKSEPPRPGAAGAGSNG